LSVQPIALTEFDDFPNGANGTAPYEAITWLLNEYQKTHPNVTIKAQHMEGSAQLNKLLSEAQTNSLPDIVLSDNPRVPNLVATGKFEDLKPVIDAWGEWGQYIDGSKEVVTVDNKIYGVMIGTNGLAFFYNTDMFKKAGIQSPPTTWDELLADAQKLKASVPGLTHGAILVGGGCAGYWQLLPFIYQQGVDIDNLEAPEIAAAVDLYKSFLDTGVATKEIITSCQTQDLQEFIAGNIGMVEEGPWSLPAFQEANFTSWGDFSIPLRSSSNTLSTPLGGEVWMMPKNTPEKEAAVWDFIKWTQTPDILLEFNKRLGYVSVRSALWPQQEAATPALKAFIDELAGAKGRTSKLGANFNAYAGALNTAVQQVLTGQKDTASALAAAQKAAVAGTK
jgi:multiple sugar transport system substrate-binding protein